MGLSCAVNAAQLKKPNELKGEDDVHNSDSQQTS